MSDIGYIIDQDQQHRESVATRYLLQTIPASERLLEPLGLSPFSWAIVELRLDHIVPGIIGELDILAGPLSWTDHARFAQEREKETSKLPHAHPDYPAFLAAKTLAESGGIAWPPPMDYLVGVEVKCAYNDEGTIKSEKKSREKVKGIRKQLDRDLQLGLDRVALVDIIAHQPTSGIDGAAWIAAGADARSSIRRMAPVLAARLANELPNGEFTPEPSMAPVGHFVWSIGSIAGADETIRGAGAPVLLRQAQPNPQHNNDREVLEHSLLCLLSHIPVPTSWPVLLTDCPWCNHLHALTAVCPGSA